MRIYKKRTNQFGQVTLTFYDLLPEEADKLIELHKSFQVL